VLGFGTESTSRVPFIGAAFTHIITRTSASALRFARLLALGSGRVRLGRALGPTQVRFERPRRVGPKQVAQIELSRSVAHTEALREAFPSWLGTTPLVLSYWFVADCFCSWRSFPPVRL
jgi:hypothetical protein